MVLNKEELMANVEEMTRQAHFIEQVIGTTPDLIYIMDIDTGKLIYANRNWPATAGYSPAEIASITYPLFDIIHEDDIATMNEQLKEMKTVMRDDKVIEIEFRVVGPNGEIFWFLDRSSVFGRDNIGIPVEKVGIAVDITEKKLQQERIITNLDIISQAEAIVKMGTWEYDTVSRQFKWSEGMYQLFNIPRGAKVTPHIYFDYTPNDEHEKVKKIVNNIEYDFEAFEEIVTITPRNEASKVIKIKAVVMRDKKKKPLKVVGVDLDITQPLKDASDIEELNKAMNKRNLELEALNSELRTFNMVASRDYKETIQTLYTNLEYIVGKEAHHLSDPAKANIRRAQAAIQKMKLLTEDINAYLRLYDIGIHRSWIDPNPVLADVHRGMKGKLEQAGATVETATLPELYSDPVLLSILLHHIIDNSVKFRQAQVSPMISLKYCHADELNAVGAAMENTHYIIISVADNGIGFDDQHSERVFDLFFRIEDKVKSRGSGIGLAVCKKIMTMHDGFITAKGIPAQGTVINCYFPGLRK